MVTCPPAGALSLTASYVASTASESECLSVAGPATGCPAPAVEPMAASDEDLALQLLGRQRFRELLLPCLIPTAAVPRDVLMYLGRRVRLDADRDIDCRPWQRSFDRRCAAMHSTLRVWSPAAAAVVAGQTPRQLRQIQDLRYANADSEAFAAIVASAPALHRVEAQQPTGAFLEGLAAAPLPTLVTLELHGASYCSDGEFQHLAALQRLDRLVITHTGTFGPRAMAAVLALPVLTDLRVPFCTGLSDAQFEALRGHPTLTAVNAGATAIGAAGLEALAAIPNLTQLTVFQAAELDDASFAALASAKKLRSLCVAETQFGRVGAHTVAAHPAVMEVNLWRCPALSWDDAQGLWDFKPDLVRVDPILG